MTSWLHNLLLSSSLVVLIVALAKLMKPRRSRDRARLALSKIRGE
jgi:hypothetical protein